MNRLVEELRRHLAGEVRLNEPLREHTTFRIGGPADVFVIPKGEADLALTLRLSHEHGVPCRPIGGGTNLLVSDAGVRGVVVKIWKPLGEIDFQGCRVKVGAGAPLPKLAKLAADRGLGGLEFAGGIPGTVGGAIVMNAGAHGGDIGRLVRLVRLYDRTGTCFDQPPEYFEFTYRTSRLQRERHWVVAWVELELEPREPAVILEAMKAYAARRRRTQPLGLPSSGSIFRNPPGDYAGRLIEAAGLKGLRCGDAEVSPVHANFIVNVGQATANDVMRLITQVRQAVYDKFGVSLQLEVELVGWEDQADVAGVRQ